MPESYVYPSDIESSGQPFLCIEGSEYASILKQRSGDLDPGKNVLYKIIIPQTLQSNDNLTYEQTSILGAKNLANLDESIGTLLNTLTGLTPDSIANNASAILGGSSNPKEELLFKTPELRSHIFTFNMFAKNEKDASNIVEIIKSLREKAYPTFYGAGTGSNFFAFPYQFSIYQGVSQDNAFPKIDAAFLTSISTNYAGSGRVSLTPDEFFQSIELTLTFQDIRIHTSEDINGLL